MTPEERGEQEMYRQKATNEAYKRLFATDDGKRVLEDLKRTYHFNSTTITPGDPQGTHYHEGQRTVVLGIQQKIDAIFEKPQEDTNG